MSARERLLASLAPELVEALEELIEERLQASRNGTGRAWLTVETAADYCDVSARSVQRWIKRGFLRPSHALDRPLISRADLDRFLESRKT
jgi:excisionase family DNA binding protein